jgi:hypothetical protein
VPEAGISSGVQKQGGGVLVLGTIRLA